MKTEGRIRTADAICPTVVRSEFTGLVTPEPPVHPRPKPEAYHAAFLKAHIVYLTYCIHSWTSARAPLLVSKLTIRDLKTLTNAVDFAD
jgi:hypothetical protein